MTRSVEWTIENILDGVLTVPHHLIEEPQTESIQQTQTTVANIAPSSSVQNSSDPRLDIPFADRYRRYKAIIIENSGTRLL